METVSAGRLRFRRYGFLNSGTDPYLKSATVNHGGGLRKQRERVYANPCHYAQAAFTAFANATPVGLEIETEVREAPRVVPQLRSAAAQVRYGVIDALAALTKEGDLLISIVHRDDDEPSACQFCPAASLVRAQPRS